MSVPRQRRGVGTSGSPAGNQHNESWRVSSARSPEMNLIEKKRCLFCGGIVRPVEDAWVMATVLVAHQRCLPGVRS